MKRSLVFRFGLLALVAVVLAAPLYTKVIETLLWLVPLTLSIGLVGWELVRQQRQGGSQTPSALITQWGGRLAQSVPVVTALLAQRGRRLLWALVKFLYSRLLAHRRRLLAPLGGLAALAFWLGYRLPGFDRHPTWPEFPGVTNPRFVVKQVPDFAERYGRRYHLPASIQLNDFSFDEYYRANLKNVRALGFQQTGNDFAWDVRFHGLAGGNNADQPPTPSSNGFHPSGYQYLELTLAGEKGYCKGAQYQTANTLATFYQYNYPATARDTLFIRFKGLDYYMYVR
jgi:hypothetical protein